jgi:hypothetical protein
MGSDRDIESPAQLPCRDHEFGWLPQPFDHREPPSVVEDPALSATGDRFRVIAVNQKHPTTGTQSSGDQRPEPRQPIIRHMRQPVSEETHIKTGRRRRPSKNISVNIGDRPRHPPPIQTDHFHRRIDRGHMHGMPDQMTSPQTGTTGILEHHSPRREPVQRGLHLGDISKPPTFLLRRQPIPPLTKPPLVILTRPQPVVLHLLLNQTHPTSLNQGHRLAQGCWNAHGGWGGR